MLHVDRQKKILDMLYKKGTVKVSQLSEYFGVHEETIRRDLKALASDWNIELVYGGACIGNGGLGPSVKELNLITKRSRNYEEKQLIAQKAAALIEPGDTVGLNSGSTVEYILDYLAGKTPLNIVTVNVNVAAKAALLEDVQVYLPGGVIRGKSGAVIGPGSAEFIKSFSIDKCFFGTSAICIAKGLTHPVLEEVESNQAMLWASAKCYAVCDSSKIGKTSLFRMADLESMDAFIVDNDPPEDFRSYLALHQIQML